MLTQPSLHRVDDMWEAVCTQDEAGGLLVKAWSYSKNSVVQDLQGHDTDVAGREEHPRARGRTRAGFSP